MTLPTRRDYIFLVNIPATSAIVIGDRLLGSANSAVTTKAYYVSVTKFESFKSNIYRAVCPKE